MLRLVATIADGDPKVPELFSFYVKEGGNPSAPGAPDAGKYSKKKAPVAQVGARAAGSAASAMTAADASNPRPGVAAHAKSTSRVHPYRSQDGTLLKEALAVVRGGRVKCEEHVVTFEGMDDIFEGSVQETTGKLHVPRVRFTETTRPNGQPAAIWRRIPIECDKRGKCGISLALDGGDHILPFPIFTPSFRRFAPGPTQAKLDIRKMMGETDYTQIVAVKSSQVEAYKEQFPLHVFFELPPEAEELAIGCSRYYMKQLAHILRAGNELSSPFCFVADDNMDYWSGITLTGDPHPQFPTANNPLASLPDKMRLHSVRQIDVLRHFSKDTGTYKASDFAILGFGKLRTQGTTDPVLGHISGVIRRNAYLRHHVYSAYILNLDNLEDIEYGRKHFAMEDISFNRRVSEKGLVVCKCMRWQFYKPNQAGGCSYAVKQNLQLTSLPEVKSGVDAPRNVIEEEEDLGLEDGEPKSYRQPVERDLPAIFNLSDLTVEQVDDFTVAFFISSKLDPATAVELGRLLGPLEQSLNGVELADPDLQIEDLKEYGIKGPRARKLHDHIQLAKANGVTPEMLSRAY